MGLEELERAMLEPLPKDAPSGTPVLVVTDDRRIWKTRTRSKPWQLGGIVAREFRRDGDWIVLLDGQTGGYALERCFVDTSQAVDDLIGPRET